MIEFILNYWVEFIFGIVAAALTGGFRSLYKRYQNLKEENSAVKDGMCALLRAELIRSGQKYMKKGYCEIYAKEAYDKAYIAYHNLGGNGTMTELHESVMNLQVHSPKQGGNNGIFTENDPTRIGK